MAKVHGMPGEWARVNGMVRGLWPLGLWIFASGLSLGLAFSNIFVGCFAFIVTSALAVWYMNIGLQRVESFFKGAKGEEHVAAILAGLPDGYEVFHDYIIGSEHLDHIVVSSSGILVLETKCWQGPVTLENDQVLTDGKVPDHSPVDQTRREVELVKEHLKSLGWTGVIQGALVFASDTFTASADELLGIAIVNSRDLINFIRQQPAVLTDLEVTRIAQIMEN